MYRNINTGGPLPKHRYIQTHLAPIIADFCDIKTVLDIGCGYGYIVDELDRLYPKAKISGVDIDPEVISFAKDSFESDNVSFSIADCARLPYADKQFDLSLLMFTARMCPVPLTAYREAFRVASKFVVLADTNVDVLTADDDRVTYFDTLQHFIACCPTKSFELLCATYVDPVNFYTLWISSDLLDAKKALVLEDTKSAQAKKNRPPGTFSPQGAGIARRE